MTLSFVFSLFSCFFSISFGMMLNYKQIKMNRTKRLKTRNVRERFQVHRTCKRSMKPGTFSLTHKVTWPPSAAVAQSGAATAANIAGNGRCVLRSCSADETRFGTCGNPLPKDGQCDVNAQFRESLGEPLRKRPVRGR